MTYDDGILRICTVSNAAKPGKKPVERLTEKSKHYYGYDNIGVTRHYAAKQANQQISCVVNVPDWNDIRATDICILEEGTQYEVEFVQPMLDENGLRMMKLTLERVKQDYEVPGED